MGCAPSNEVAHSSMDGVMTPANYIRNPAGVREQTYDFRANGGDKVTGRGRPNVRAGELYTDKDFGLFAAIPKPKSLDLEFQRPKEFAPEARLFGEGVINYYVQQGGCDSCSFITALAGIAEHPQLLKQVIPLDAYENSAGRYDGVFKARYWRFGRWEDVYIDDRLPVDDVEYRAWGAIYSDDVKSQTWVSLLEKAFARLVGGYEGLERKADGEYYLALTGGVAEKVNVKKKKGKKKAKKLFTRIQRALNRGYHLTAYIPERCDGEEGLAGDHCYWVTGTAELSGDSLIRLVNPWGYSGWEGQWCKWSELWRSVPKHKRPTTEHDRGEFWMSMGDFVKYVQEANICGLTPDSDQDDGVYAALRFVTNVYGEWRGETAAGGKDKLSNPRFSFTVPETNKERPIVIQLIQDRDTIAGQDYKMRCDLYRVVSSEDGKGESTLEILRNKKDAYRKDMQCLYRHKVTSGTYTIIPSLEEAGLERSFLIRIFSSRPLSAVTELPQSHILKLTDNNAVKSIPPPAEPSPP